jgi:1-acyl-sn-glycerol-3-phosphate acyltransferase
MAVSARTDAARRGKWALRDRRGRIASWLRSKLWGGVFALASDGLTVEGSLPPGPCVLVANHGSHADTAALLAAFGRQRPLLVVAAADYWLASPVRRAAASTLAGILPISRHQSGRDQSGRDQSGGSDPLAGAAAALARGTSVVIFPEGTRSQDGTLGRFRSGAFRLAAQAGVPVVPVGLTGTREILPKHGRLTRVPVAVRVGEPLAPAADPVDTEAVRVTADRAGQRVAGLAAAPAQPSPGRTWRRMSRWTGGWPGWCWSPGGWPARGPCLRCRVWAERWRRRP